MAPGRSARARVRDGAGSPLRHRHGRGQRLVDLAWIREAAGARVVAGRQAACARRAVARRPLRRTHGACALDPRLRRALACIRARRSARAAARAVRARVAPRDDPYAVRGAGPPRRARVVARRPLALDRASRRRPVDLRRPRPRARRVAHRAPVWRSAGARRLDARRVAFASRTRRAKIGSPLAAYSPGGNEEGPGYAKVTSGALAPPPPATHSERPSGD